MVLGQSQEKPKSLSPEEILKLSGPVKEIIFPNDEFLKYDNELIEVQFKNMILGTKLFPEVQKQLDEALVGYLKAPVIIDDFTDDRDRNELENNVHDIGREGSALYKSNRLRITNIRHVIQLSDMMTLFGVLKEEQKEKIKKQIEDVWEGVADRSDENKRKDNFEKYDKMTIQEKVAFSDKVADLARSACIALIESQKK